MNNLNVNNFSKRLEKILDYYELSASAFADRIGVQRSSISHVLSGRNKPSLDFVMKIISSCQEVDYQWLLNGIGNFPKKLTDNISTTPAPDSFNENPPSIELSGTDKKLTSNVIPKDSVIDRIVIFYKDGTFTEYNNDSL